MKNKHLIYALIITGIAFVTRFAYLGILPPGGKNAFWLRLPSAVSGILLVIIFMWLVKQLTNDDALALLSGLVLTLMPWQIEQGRIYSQPLLGLTLILLESVILILVSRTYVKIVSMIATAIAFYYLYPSFFLFNKMDTFNLYYYFNNLFKLLSAEFLFFKNDSFWSGGMRFTGVFLPSAIPVFLIGLYQIIKQFQKKNWLLVIGFAGIWLIAAANPKFPEGREFFLATPFFAIVCAYGLQKLLAIIKQEKFISKLLVICLLIISLYEYIWFFHMYVNHYSRRVAGEITYEEIKF